MSITENIIDNGELKKLSPVNLKELRAVKISTDKDIKESIETAKRAFDEWSSMKFVERASLLKRACKRMLSKRNKVLQIMFEESGKYPSEGLMSEAIGPLDQLNNWIKVVRPMIKQQKLPISPIACPGKKGYTKLVPRGIVGVIAPWNYSYANYFKPVFPALLSGNCVIVKPSEYTPRMGEWFVNELKKYLPEGVISCVQGGADVGRTLIQSGIDALVFTGSVESGKKVSQMASEMMIPCSVELGGKDPAIVLQDCNLERTVAGVINWSLHNSGQNCGAIERVYVVDEIADRFTEKLSKAVKKLRVIPADDMTIDISPMNNLKQLKIVEEHVKDALDKGAVCLAGGKATGNGYWFEPTVLDNCDHNMKIINEETFGPVIPIIRVSNLDMALKLANNSKYGLTASIWTKNIAFAEEVSEKIEVGTVTINNHAISGAMPFAPWTGVKETGHGIANSKYALTTFTRPKTVIIDKNKSPDPWWFPFNQMLIDMGHALADVQLGKVLNAIKLPAILSRRKKVINNFIKSD